jgi:hypothetical protein
MLPRCQASRKKISPMGEIFCIDKVDKWKFEQYNKDRKKGAAGNG